MDSGPVRDDRVATGTDPAGHAEETTQTVHEETSLSWVFDALSSSRSRHVLYSLTAASATLVTVDDLIESVGVRESADGTVPDEATLGDIRSSLHHAHLPKLADMDLLTYDWLTGEVSLTKETDRIEPFLSFSREADER